MIRMPLKHFGVGAILLISASIATAAASERGLPEAQKALASGDYATSFAIYKRIAEKNKDPLAYFSLALHYQNGWGTLKDPKFACVNFEKAAAGGIPTAAHFHAECLARGVRQPADPAKAAIWYEKAANWGHLISYCSLADLYMTGAGVPKDPGKGLLLCSQAAAINTSAQIQMGRYYLEGDATIRSPKDAYQWFHMAAERNVAEAQYLLGMMERDGIGRPKSAANALPWFESAAAQGYLPAYLPTAELYFSRPGDAQTGKPVAENLAKSYLWLSAVVRRSANAGEKERAANLLKEVLSVMPASWMPELDEKVDSHVKKFSPNTPAGR